MNRVAPFEHHKKAPYLPGMYPEDVAWEETPAADAGKTVGYQFDLESCFTLYNDWVSLYSCPTPYASGFRQEAKAFRMVVHRAVEFRRAGLLDDEAFAFVVGNVCGHYAASSVTTLTNRIEFDLSRRLAEKGFWQRLVASAFQADVEGGRNER